MTVLRISQKSMGRIDRMIRDLEHLGTARLLSDAEGAALAEDLDAAMHREFSPHTKTGQSEGSITHGHDGQTIWADISFGGPYVEFGWHKPSGAHYDGDDFAGRALDDVMGAVADELGAAIGRAFVSGE